MRLSFSASWLMCVTLTIGLAAGEPGARPSGKRDARAAAAEVDRLILEELARAGVGPAPAAADEDFLRRVSLDLAGTLPEPQDVTLFGLDPDPAKRENLIDRLLESEEFARNWAGYWRDVIFSRATNMRARFAEATFERWMEQQLAENRPWDEIASELITATGDVVEEGATGLIFAQEGNAEEIAAEVSRIFLGIQIQCANCHDHPVDSWKREQFHELAAFFPRVQVRPKVMDGQQRGFEVASFNQSRGGRGEFRENAEVFFRRLDRNRDNKLVKSEVEGTPLERPFEFILQRGDTDKDGAISLAELKAVPPPPNMPGRGSAEHYMPDLNDPASRGTKIDPVFFVSRDEAEAGLADLERRRTLARELTSPVNPWFAKAFVNRIWAELLGEGFYMPVDDIGPEREPRFPKALDVLSSGFAGSGYDVKWLFRTITSTAAYQRSARAKSLDGQTPPFAAATPTRLRADQLYSALLQVAGADEPPDQGPPRGPGGLYRRPRSPRGQFRALFGFDPSTPQDDLTGDVPQALFLMNSPQVNALARAERGTRLAKILEEFPDDQDAVSELYLLVHSREPSQQEWETCRDYIRSAGDRPTAYEDLMWCLLNSSEFLSKR